MALSLLDAAIQWKSILLSLTLGKGQVPFPEKELGWREHILHNAFIFYKPLLSLCNVTLWFVASSGRKLELISAATSYCLLVAM